jgi:lipopolysaccharide export system protein LptA
MGRIVRTAGSFGIMVLAYWAYAVVAVPLIEPPADRYESDPLSDEEREDAGRRVDHRLTELEGLFPPGSWELNSPQILESDRVKLLVPKYINRPDGSVEFSRCTIILSPNAPGADPAERKRRMVILQASEGARLTFDQPLSLRHANLGRLRLVSGILQGQVTIRSQGKLPGPEDDLLIVTRDVELTEDQISTPHAVEFRLGPNYGSGSHMRISLLSGEDDSDGHGLSVTGIEWFELRRLKQLCLWLPRRPDMPGSEREPATGGRVPPDRGVPIEIGCRGPFRYDHVRQEASFEDRVDVLQINPQGPADKITCERLSVFFARSRQAVSDLMDPDSKGKGQRVSGEFDLEPCRIEAWGNPVVVSAPSQGVQAQGERLEYDLQHKRIVLDYPDDGHQHAEVFLRHGANEIHGRSLQYESMGPGRLGRITAQGPGWISAQIDDRPPRQLQATWSNQLLVRPHEGQQVISLTGDSELTFSQLGTLAADEIHFWLFELPPDDSTPNGQPQLRPDRMSALHNVRLNSPQLTGAVEELGIWFEEEDLLHAKPESARPATGRITGVLPVHLPAEPTGASGGQPTARPAARLQQFDITGKVLTSKVIIRDDEPELSELTVEGNVLFRETWTAEPDQPPLIITGDQVQVFNADTPDTEVVVVGLNPPARLEGRGRKLSGTNIKLDRGSNRMWINGMGQMELPLKRDMEGRPLARPGVLNIDWQGKMEFDGRTVSFFESVSATGPNQRMATQKLVVSLTETIDFADPSMDREPDVAKIECYGGVVMDNWSFKGPAQTSWDRMQSEDLAIDRISGEIVGLGPGRVTTVRLGTPKLSGSPFNRGGDADRSAGSEAASNKLTYLNVEFQDRLEGNLHDRTLTFYGQVHCVYGPVDSWDATLDMDDPDSLGPNGALLTSDELTVTQMTSPLDDTKSMELVARDNVRVEGKMFNASGHRMTYDHAKDLLILEGTGRADAELFYQKRAGAPPQHAKMGKIRFRRSTNQIQIDDARSVEFNQFPTQ